MANWMLLDKKNMEEGTNFQWNGEKYQVYKNMSNDNAGVLICHECFKSSGRPKKSKFVRIIYSNENETHVRLLRMAKFSVENL